MTGTILLVEDDASIATVIVTALEDEGFEVDRVDGIAGRDRLLADAKARALAMAEGYQPAEPKPLRLPGPTGRATLNMAVQRRRRNSSWVARRDLECTHAPAIAELRDQTRALFNCRGFFLRQRRRRRAHPLDRRLCFVGPVAMPVRLAVGVRGTTMAC